MRLPIIAGNWRMNKTAEEAAEFANQVKNKVPSGEKVESVVIPPDLFVAQLIHETTGTELKVGAQNCYFEDFGSFTGETSPAALSKLGAEYVILGHSERRQYFHETNEEINKKVLTVLKHKMKPIVCVGETLEEREAGDTNKKVKNQVQSALKDVSANQIQHVVIAYEPIWAIGSGKTASGEEANKTAQTIRETVADLYTRELAESVRIQYGGS